MSKKILRYRFDGAGAWFQTLGSLGEDMDIRFGKKLVGQNGIQWIKGIDHAVYDGVGGLLKLVRSHGAPDFKDVPKLKENDEPVGVMEWLKMTARQAREAKKNPAPAGQGKVYTSLAEASVRVVKDQPAPVAARVFDPELSKRFLEGARARKVTLNTALLFTLNQAMRDALRDPQADFPWMIPVNMRGGVAMPTETMNHSSFLDVRSFHDDSLSALHSRIQEMIKKKRHWWYWHFLQITALVGQRGRLKLLGFQRSQRTSIGSFSNLGQWNLPANSEVEAWLFTPPVSHHQTLGAGCITTYGRLSLALQIHASVPNAQGLVDEIVAGWEKHLREFLPA